MTRRGWFNMTGTCSKCASGDAHFGSTHPKGYTHNGSLRCNFSSPGAFRSIFAANTPTEMHNGNERRVA